MTDTAIDLTSDFPTSGIRARHAYPVMEYNALPNMTYNETSQQHVPPLVEASLVQESIPRRYSKRVYKAFRSIVAPMQPKKWDDPHVAAKPPPTKLQRAARCVGAITLAVCAIFVAAVFVARFYSTGGSINKTIDATMVLLNIRDHVEIVPKVILPHNGIVVENVLNPTRPLSSVNDVRMMSQKIRDTPNGRVFPIDAQSIQSGYITYKYMSSVDLSAEPVAVNATLDKVFELMQKSLPAGMLCEGMIHYGIERNAILVQQWSNAKNSPGDDQMLYNPTLSEHSAATVEWTDEIANQTMCRFNELVFASPNALKEGTLHASATLEYTTERGLKKRRKIQQPLLMCIQHVLKLSGL